MVTKTLFQEFRYYYYLLSTHSVIRMHKHILGQDKENEFGHSDGGSGGTSSLSHDVGVGGRIGKIRLVLHSCCMHANVSSL